MPSRRRVTKDRFTAYSNWFEGDLTHLEVRLKLDEPGYVFVWRSSFEKRKRSGKLMIHWQLSAEAKLVITTALDAVPRDAQDSTQVQVRNCRNSLSASRHDVTNAVQLAKILAYKTFQMQTQTYNEIQVARADKMSAYTEDVVAGSSTVQAKLQQEKEASWDVGRQTVARWSSDGSPEPGETIPEPASTAKAPTAIVLPVQHTLNIVLEGVPGTGKTYAINELRTGVLRTLSTPQRSLTDAKIHFMTMHPSTSYEDFVEGLRPAAGAPKPAQREPVAVRGPTESLIDEDATRPDSGWYLQQSAQEPGNFAVRDGFFVRACADAAAHPNHAVVIVLDELNRCNIPKVLGDLLTVIETSKRALWSPDGPNGGHWKFSDAASAVTLPYSGRKLFVPDNIFIIGTMNTTDRSVAPLDAALRRRFSFIRLWPHGFSGQKAVAELVDMPDELQSAHMSEHTQLWLRINNHMLGMFGADAILGHSYLYDLRDALSAPGCVASAVACHHWNHRILPQLLEIIASNGLTRSLVGNPKRFFGGEGAEVTGPTRVRVFDDQLEVVVSGNGTTRSAHIQWVERSNS